MPSLALNENRLPEPEPACAAVVPGFEADEISWLREEAIAARRRFGDHAVGAVSDAHSLEPVFLRVARHPRILELAAAALRAPVRLSASTLHFGLPTILRVPLDRLVFLLHLGRSPDADIQTRISGAIGELRVAGPAAALALPDGVLHLSLTYARSGAQGTALTPIEPDGLWPPAAFCAG
jgi:hypothetical protein